MSDTFLQIDLVSTLSLIYNIPIPFSNIGQVCIELLNYPINPNHLNPQISSLYRIHQSLSLNLIQIYKYIKVYGESTSVDVLSVIAKHSKKSFNEIEKLFQSIKINPYKENISKKEENNLNNDINNYLELFNNIRSASKEIWETINVTGMINSVLLMVTPILLFIIILFYNIQFNISWIITILQCLFVAIVIDFTFEKCHCTMIVCIVSIIVWLITMIYNFELKILSFDYIMPIIMIIFHLWSLFSNSYIENENQFSFVLSQIGLFFIFIDMCRLYSEKSNRKNHLSYKILVYPLISIISLRLSKECSFQGIENIPVTNYKSIYPLMLLPLLYMLYSHFYDKIEIIDMIYFFIIYCETLTILLYWGLTNQMNPFKFNYQLVFPRLIYLTTIILLIIHYLKKDSCKSILTFSICLVLLTGPNSPIMIFYITLSLLSLYVSFEKLEENNNDFHSYTNNNYFKSILLNTIGYHYFYISGHTPKINGIQYNSAFIGFNEFNLLLSGFIVVINTFGGWILLFLFSIFLCKNIEKNKREYTITTSIYHLLNTFCSMIFVIIVRRHLMVKDIFIPKLLFDFVTGLIVMIITMFLLPFY